MFWFRVELDEKGKVLSCTQVAKVAEGEAGGVFFFKASNSKSASEKAYREYHRLRQQARRARYAAEGRCKCGRSRDKETPEQRARAYCPSCVATQQRFDERERLQKQGIEVPPVDKAARFVDRRNEEKLELLQEVQDKFLRSTMGVFGKWLQGEIEKLQPKPVTKLRVVGNR